MVIVELFLLDGGTAARTMNGIVPTGRSTAESPFVSSWAFMVKRRLNR